MEDIINNKKTILEEFHTISGLLTSVFRQLRIINHQ